MSFHKDLEQVDLHGVLLPLSGVGSPVGSIVPTRPGGGVLYTDTNNGDVWVSNGPTAADWQLFISMGTPALHAPTHQHGGTDEISTATPGANAIPKANGLGVLNDGWISQGAVTQHQAAIDHDALLNYVANEHVPLDDGLTTTNNIWSAQQIQDKITALQAGLDLKDSVETVADTNITLSGEQTLNGVLTSGSRVGVVGQTTATENGIYVTAAGAWTRASDADSDDEVTQGLSFFVAAGNKQGFQYILTTPDPISVGSTPLTFVEIKRVEFGTTSGTATEGNDPRVPSQTENDALVGTNGIPSTVNPYVTDTDPRNTNARTPTSHAGTHQHGGSDEVATAIPGANEIPKAEGTGFLNPGWLEPKIEALFTRTTNSPTIAAAVVAVPLNNTILSATGLIINGSGQIEVQASANGKNLWFIGDVCLVGDLTNPSNSRSNFAWGFRVNGVSQISTFSQQYVRGTNGGIAHGGSSTSRLYLPSVSTGDVIEIIAQRGSGGANAVTLANCVRVEVREKQ